MQNSLNSLVEGGTDKQLIQTFIYVMHEFKMSYEEVKNLPLPAYNQLVEFLRQKYKKKDGTSKH